MLKSGGSCGAKSLWSSYVLYFLSQIYVLIPESKLRSIDWMRFVALKFATSKVGY
jgi:hypothetical protein